MKKLYLPLVSICFMLLIQSCSKKTVPTQTTVSETKTDTVVVIKKTDSTAVVKTVRKPKVKEAVPKVIVVNDQYAKKSVDGRYYYDLKGHRYWRSNKDGKYYLFNKSMMNDEAFKKPQ